MPKDAILTTAPTTLLHTTLYATRACTVLAFMFDLQCGEDTPTDGKNRWMDGWMDGWLGGWVGGWVDGWMDGWMDGQRHRQID